MLLSTKCCISSESRQIIFRCLCLFCLSPIAEVSPYSPHELYPDHFQLSLFIFTMLLSTYCYNGSESRQIIFLGLWLFVCHRLPRSPLLTSRAISRPVSLFIFKMLYTTYCCNDSKSRQIIFRGLWLFVCHRLPRSSLTHLTNYIQTTFTLHSHDATVNLLLHW